LLSSNGAKLPSADNPLISTVTASAWWYSLGFITSLPLAATDKPLSSVWFVAVFGLALFASTSWAGFSGPPWDLATAFAPAFFIKAANFCADSLLRPFLSKTGLPANMALIFSGLALN